MLSTTTVLLQYITVEVATHIINTVRWPFLIWFIYVLVASCLSIIQLTLTRRLSSFNSVFHTVLGVLFLTFSTLIILPWLFPHNDPKKHHIH